MKFTSEDEEFINKYNDLWDSGGDDVSLREVWKGLHPVTRAAIRGFYDESESWTLFNDFRMMDKNIRKQLFQMKLDELEADDV